MSDHLYSTFLKYVSGRQTKAVQTAENFALGSAVGSVRSRNEDVSLVLSTQLAGRPERDFTLALVCDGMGGMKEGQAAAQMAASAFAAQMVRGAFYGKPAAQLALALKVAQDQVYSALHGAGGTTLSAIYVDSSSTAWLAHVGDTRIYAWEEEGFLTQLTRDDTMAAALKQIGEGRPDGNRLIQFIGIEDGADPQILPIETDGLRGFLLTTDGAHAGPETLLDSIAQHARGPTDLVRKLLTLADMLGGIDNATAVHVPAGRTEVSSATGWDSILSTIISVSGEHDLCLQLLPGGPRADHYQSEVSPVREYSERPANTARQAPKARASRKRSAAKPKSERDDPNRLPLEMKPEIKLDFSDDEGQPT